MLALNKAQSYKATTAVLVIATSSHVLRLAMNTRRPVEYKRKRPTSGDTGDTEQHEPAVNEPPQESSDDETFGSQNSIEERERNGDDRKSSGGEVEKRFGQKKLKRNEPIQRDEERSVLRESGIFEPVIRRSKPVKRFGGPKAYRHRQRPFQRDVKPQKLERTSQDDQDGESDEKKSERQSAVRKRMALLDELMDEPGSDDIPHENQRLAQDKNRDAMSEGSELSDAQSVTFEDATAASKIGKAKEAIICPVCSFPIDTDLEDECLYIATQPFRMQSAFCQRHTRKNAMDEWAERSYPEIDWAKIDDRISACFPALEDIITGKRPSFYRDLLTSQTNEEVDKSTMKKFRLTVESKGLENISTGYYGPRGAKLMVDTLIRHFARKMRKLAPSDDLIKNASVAGFVQAVLVPELTLLFVKEDMHVDDNEALQIIEHSKKVGELLNDQPHDTMTADL
ncbi:hypothetical protein KEM54_006354 [Ascosphaera aggregata]|nr:hypothetical protein KEM54_006354 [Ascosphaera aggregata]